MNAPVIILPRLLDEASARQYLNGVDPRKVAEPIYLGRSVRWDRKLLDKVLDQHSGLEEEAQPATGDAYAERRRRKAGNAG